jgi:hypothetical protein
MTTDVVVWDGSVMPDTRSTFTFRYFFMHSIVYQHLHTFFLLLMCDCVLENSNILMLLFDENVKTEWNSMIELAVKGYSREQSQLMSTTMDSKNPGSKEQFSLLSTLKFLFLLFFLINNIESQRTYQSEIIERLKF